MSEGDTLRIVTLRDRPDLAPVVVHWIWHAFWKPEGSSRDSVEMLIEAAKEDRPLPQTFVLLEGERPAGTASLVAQDLDSRPDLTPWLAAVFVAPSARRRGYAARLVAAVERHARVDAGAQGLWLYTHTAEALYARCGWTTRDRFFHCGAEQALMCKHLR